MGQSTRSSTTTGTIPAATAISGGTFTRDTNKTTAIIYTGTDVLTDIFPDTATGDQGYAWIYFASSATPKLFRVIGVTLIDDTNPAALEYVVLLDRAISAISSVSGSYIYADLKSYAVVNEGSASGIFDGVTLAAGASINQAIQYPLNWDWLEAKTFDATGTTFLIKENK